MRRLQWARALLLSAPAAKGVPIPGPGIPGRSRPDGEWGSTCG
jgi:hypothetical protein